MELDEMREAWPGGPGLGDLDGRAVADLLWAAWQHQRVAGATTPSVPVQGSAGLAELYTAVQLDERLASGDQIEALLGRVAQQDARLLAELANDFETLQRLERLAVRHELTREAVGALHERSRDERRTARQRVDRLATALRTREETYRGQDFAAQFGDRRYTGLPAVAAHLAEALRVYGQQPAPRGPKSVGRFAGFPLVATDDGAAGPAYVSLTLTGAALDLVWSRLDGIDRARLRIPPGTRHPATEVAITGMIGTLAQGLAGLDQAAQDTRRDLERFDALDRYAAELDAGFPQQAALDAASARVRQGRSALSAQLAAQLPGAQDTATPSEQRGLRELTDAQLTARVENARADARLADSAYEQTLRAGTPTDADYEAAARTLNPHLATQFDAVQSEVDAVNAGHPDWGVAISAQAAAAMLGKPGVVTQWHAWLDTVRTANADAAGSGGWDHMNEWSRTAKANLAALEDEAARRATLDPAQRAAEEARRPLSAAALSPLPTALSTAHAAAHTEAVQWPGPGAAL